MPYQAWEQVSYVAITHVEEHAEHEYMQFVAEHPELEHEPFTSAVAHDYADVVTMADLFRQIAHDERTHKELSLQRMQSPSFR